MQSITGTYRCPVCHDRVREGSSCQKENCKEQMAEAVADFNAGVPTVGNGDQPFLPGLEQK